MPRLARIVIPGCPHHITQRGNNRQDVFFVDDDREVYLALLKQESERRGLAVLGYCLMTNHVHLVATPQTESSLAQAVGRTHFRYAQYVNRFHGRMGHLWQGRFHSCALDERHTLLALQYAERNPVRAKLVRSPWRYGWSSAAAHVGERDRSGVLDLDWWREAMDPDEWREVLGGPADEAGAAGLCRNTQTGRPLGSDSFLGKLERTVGRRLRPLPVGRPRKETGKTKRRRKR